MAPYSEDIGEFVLPKETKKQEYKIKIVWHNVLLCAVLHAAFFYAIYLCFTSASLKTIIFAYIYGTLGLVGSTAGTHRLWSHRSYKAKWPMRALLCCFASIAGQQDILQWARDHRVHHKYTETNADPHSMSRGFFFAHMGWLLCKKHPDVIEKGKAISVEDLWADPIVRFHRRFYMPLLMIFRFILPTIIPVWAWGETAVNAFFVAGVGDWVFTLHSIGTINSVAHKFGDKPFDKNIEATETGFVSFFATGEGWHNYHHVFPWDYSASELGWRLNLSTLFIDFMAMIGQAYDLKTVDPQMVKSRKLKTGDGTRLHEVNKQE